MTPDEVISTVSKISVEHQFNKTEVRMLCQYFLKKHCQWLVLKSIGRITGVRQHGTVIRNIRRIEKDSNRFGFIRMQLEQLLNNVINNNYKYMDATQQTEFLEKVKKMREAQKKYFRTRQAVDKIEAMQLEKEVDTMMS